MIFSLPETVKRILRPVVMNLLDPLDGQILIDKKIYSFVLINLVRYFLFHIVVFPGYFLGFVLRIVRSVLHLHTCVRRTTKTIGNDVIVSTYNYFPGKIHSVCYTNHIPVPFLPFQINPWILSTSFFDTSFVQQTLKKLPISGFRVLGWPSNHFLGYAKRITLKKRATQNTVSNILIASCASIPGYTTALSHSHYFEKAMDKTYAEEGFLKNPNAIHFAKHNASPIVAPLVFHRETSGKWVVAISSYEAALHGIQKKEDKIILFPIATLTEKNTSHKDWKVTPIKNISGVIFGYQGEKLVCISLHSANIIRMKIPELMPIIHTVCHDHAVRFIAYMHTDDGGSVGDIYRSQTGFVRSSPRIGHGMSSFLGFAPVHEDTNVLTTLRQWDT
jgi:hypothetical protein